MFVILNKSNLDTPIVKESSMSPTHKEELVSKQVWIMSYGSNHVMVLSDASDEIIVLCNMLLNASNN